VPGSCNFVSSAHPCKLYQAQQPGIDGAVALFNFKMLLLRGNQPECSFTNQYCSLFSSFSLSYYRTYENYSHQTPLDQRTEQKCSCLPQKVWIYIPQHKMSVIVANLSCSNIVIQDENSFPSIFWYDAFFCGLSKRHCFKHTGFFKHTIFLSDFIQISLKFSYTSPEI